MGEAWTLNMRGSKFGPDRRLDDSRYEDKTQGDWTGEISKLPIKHTLTTSPLFSHHLLRQCLPLLSPLLVPLSLPFVSTTFTDVGSSRVRGLLEVAREWLEARVRFGFPRSFP